MLYFHKALTRKETKSRLSKYNSFVPEKYGAKELIAAMQDNRYISIHSIDQSVVFYKRPEQRYAPRQICEEDNALCRKMNGRFRKNIGSSQEIPEFIRHLSYCGQN